MNLFRKESIEQENPNAYGDIIITPSLGITFSALSTILLIILLMLFLTFFKYTKKAHLSGIVMPSSGLIKVTPKYPGYVTKLTVSEGDHVNKDSHLYYISGENYNGNGTLSSMISSLKTQYLILSNQKKQEIDDNINQQKTVTQRIESLKAQITISKNRLTQAIYQNKIAESVVIKYKKLINKNYVSDIDYQNKKMEYSSSKDNVENHRQILLQLQNELNSATDDLNHIRSTGESRKSEIDRQLQTIKQQQLELIAQEKFILTSPTSGTVATILIKQGQSVNAFEPVMNILPDNSRLQVELYATSQNAGFIRIGQRVSLRYSAFPYQKFGVQYGTIREISRTTLNTSDLSSISPSIWKENEGHYRVIVEPENAFIMAYGKREPLLSGMTLEGDVNLDTRYLWEWITEPIWSLKGAL